MAEQQEDRRYPLERIAEFLNGRIGMNRRIQKLHADPEARKNAELREAVYIQTLKEVTEAFERYDVEAMALELKQLREARRNHTNYLLGIGDQ
jgi:hypothetical protein